MAFESKIRPIYWENGKSKMIDQTVIPYKYKYVEITSGDEMFDAIRNMIVRGAPAIGIAGAHGVCLAAIESKGKDNFIEEIKSLLKFAGKIVYWRFIIHWLVFLLTFLYGTIQKYYLDACIISFVATGNFSGKKFSSNHARKMRS